MGLGPICTLKLAQSRPRQCSKRRLESIWQASEKSETNSVADSLDLPELDEEGDGGSGDGDGSSGHHPSQPPLNGHSFGRKISMTSPASVPNNLVGAFPFPGTPIHP